MAMTGGTTKLVYTGYANGDTSKPIRVYVYYKSTQLDTNQSRVSVGMYVTTPSGYDIGVWDDFSGSYVGTPSLTFDGTIPNFEGTYWIVEDKTFTVNHNSDGTGSATIYWKWGVNSPWGRIQNPSGSFNITLPTIDRGSVPTLSASTVRMGETLTITTNRKNTSFTHNLYYSFGGTTGTIATAVGASYAWAIPTSWVSKIVNSTSGTCTITCNTYSSGSLIGIEKINVTIHVPTHTEITVSNTSPKVGNSITINMPRKAAAFTHDLTYATAKSSGTIGLGLGTSRSWVIPLSLIADFTNATSGKVTLTCVTKNGTATVGTDTLDITVAVADATVPVLSHTSVNAGDKIRITVEDTKLSDNYTHDISYEFGSRKGDIIKNAKKYWVWDVPLDFAAEIPSKTSGTVTIICVTKNGTATVGTENVTFTVKVPEQSPFLPTLTMSLSPVGNLPSAFSGLYVQGKTKVKAAFTAKSEYSTIKSTSAAVEIGSVNKTYSGNPATTDTLSASGEISVVGVATDARGFKGKTEQTITVIPYSSPKVAPYTGERAIICERCTQDGILSESGMFLKIKARRFYHAVRADGVQKNFCSMSYRYKTANGAYSSEITLLEASNVSTNLVDVTLDNIVTSLTTSYTVQLTVKDTMGESSVYTYYIPTAGCDFHLRDGGNGAAFGKYSEKENALEIAEHWDLFLKNNPVADFIIEAGLKDGWRYKKWYSGTYEMYGTFDVEITNSTQEGNLFYSNTHQILAPFPLNTAITAGTSNRIAWICNGSLGSAGTEESKIQFVLGRTQALTIGSIYTVRLAVYGRWK